VQKGFCLQGIDNLFFMLNILWIEVINLNILFISYGIYEYDGRLRELLKISKNIGKTTCLTRAESSSSCQDNAHVAINISSRFNYIKFILKAIFIAMNMKKIDVLFIDNRKAIIPGLIIRILKRPRVIIKDVRELYLIKEVKHFAGKIGCVLEKILIDKADILICANSFRAEIMKYYYSLNAPPLIYENIRRLMFDNEYLEKEIYQKYHEIFNKDTFRIISTSGCDVSRTNDRLVLAMKDLGEKFELLLVGGGSEEDCNQILEIIQKHSIKNVQLIGKVGESELKYLIQKCQVGVVNYNKRDTNNRFCASGKIYEFIYEGLPVITTENLPLLEIVEKHCIGVSDDNYLKGIRTIYENYLFYKENVKLFSQNINVEKNNQQLIKLIKERIFF